MISLITSSLYPEFPKLDEHAPGDEPVAFGGELSQQCLLSAYSQGIFPWFSHDEMIYWWSPDPRVILVPNQFKVTRSLSKSIRNRGYTITVNQAFEDTIINCSKRKKSEYDIDEPGTWITKGMIQAYCELHRAGYAHSVETWLDGELVGGLYGVSIGKVFFGESMFSKARDSSKVALFHLVEHLKFWNFSLIDCQVRTKLFVSLGANEIPRKRFVEIVRESVKEPVPTGIWQSLQQTGSQDSL